MINISPEEYYVSLVAKLNALRYERMLILQKVHDQETKIIPGTKSKAHPRGHPARLASLNAKRAIAKLIKRDDMLNHLRDYFRDEVIKVTRPFSRELKSQLRGICLKRGLDLL